MNLEDAKNFLNTCKRMELKDHAFGDMEVWWSLNGEDVANGYFSGKNGIHAEVFINGSHGPRFEGAEARELKECGNLDEVWRNDTMGPGVFEEGKVMDGLTMEDVREEIENNHILKEPSN